MKELYDIHFDVEVTDHFIADTGLSDKEFLELIEWDTNWWFAEHVKTLTELGYTDRTVEIVPNRMRRTVTIRLTYVNLTFADYTYLVLKNGDE